LDWLDPDLSAGNDCSSAQLAPNFEQSGHPFASYRYPPITVMGRRISLLLFVTSAAETAPTSEKKAPVANLCSQLVVNEYPPDPPIHERWALTVPTTASSPAPFARTHVRTLEQHHRRWRRIAASGISDPE
jgi:hypothetical protein